MDIYATREELKSRQKNIFDLKLNVAYYARVSTDKEEQKTSIEHQWTFFEQLISDVKNWTLVDGYIDEGISGINVLILSFLNQTAVPQRGIPENAPGCKSREN